MTSSAEQNRGLGREVDLPSVTTVIEELQPQVEVLLAPER